MLQDQRAAGTQMARRTGDQPLQQRQSIRAAIEGQTRLAAHFWRQREGRSIIYAPDFKAIADVIAYLGENCCQDGGC